MDFCENLKKARQRVGLTQQQIANALGITKSTYCGYETGKRQPDLAKLRRLALLLCTSVDELLEMTGGESEYTVNPSEYDQIMRFRALDAHGQRIVRVVLAEETARMRSMMRQKPGEESSSCVIHLPVADSPITCEWSAYLGPDGFHTLHVSAAGVPPNAAYALRVRGNSLMPRFADQDLLLISHDTPLSGDIGVYIRAGRALVRLQGYNELMSINPAYPPIAEDETIRACGTVIGVLSPDSLR